MKKEKQIKLSGIILITCAASMALIGFGFQVIKNYQEQSVGISMILVLFATVVFSVRIWNSILIKNKYIIISDSIGLFMNAIVWVQYFMYQ